MSICKLKATAVNNVAMDAGPCRYHNVVTLERDRPLYSINGLGAILIAGLTIVDFD
jgi:hypothetical protein